MGRFDFQSPGAEAGDALRQFLVDREARQRQQMLDSITMQREGRLKEHDAQELALQRSQLQSVDEQRKAAMEDRASARGEQIAKTTPIGTVDDTTAGAISKFNPSLVGDQTTLPAMMAGVMPGTTAGGTAATVADATQTAPVQPVADAAPTPGQGEQQIAAAPTGQKVYKGDAEQQRQQKMQETVDGIIASNPELTKHPGVSDMMKLAAATRDYSGLYTALASMMKPVENMGVYDVSPDKKTVLRRNPANGKMEPYVGEVEKGAHFLNENQPHVTSSVQTDNRMDRSYQYNQNAVDKLRAPLEAQLERISRLGASLDQNSAAIDPLIAPEMMTAIAGGQGSGVRVTQAEITNLLHGRSTFQDFLGVIQKVKDGTSITPEQRAQMKEFVGLVNQKAQRKIDVLDKAADDLVNAGSVDEHRTIMQTARKAYHSEMDGAASTSGKSKARRYNPATGKVE